MATTSYNLNELDWTDCGASDDCTIQSQSTTQIIFTTAASKPGSGDSNGLRLVSNSGFDMSATVQRAGLKVWARTLFGNAVLMVER